jgi:cytochrome b561
MQRYTTPAIVLHWLIALLIVANFVLGLVMTDIPGLTPTKLRYFSWHKWAGIVVLALATLRLLWRLYRQPPAYPASLPAWQARVSHRLHQVLYGLMFAVPLSGYFYSMAAGVPVVLFGLFALPTLIEASPTLKPVLGALHYWLNMGLAALVAVHVLAALKHLFIDRDGIMGRMLPFSSK